MSAGVISPRPDYADDFMQISLEVASKTHATVAAWLGVANCMVVRRAARRALFICRRRVGTRRACKKRRSSGRSWAWWRRRSTSPVRGKQDDGRGDLFDIAEPPDRQLGQLGVPPILRDAFHTITQRQSYRRVSQSK
jgi:hypothetical protein